MPKYMLNPENPKDSVTNGEPPVSKEENSMPEIMPQPMSEEVFYLIQQSKEEAKFELKKELSESLNAKAVQLQEIDPTTSACLRACAIAIAEALSSVIPVGQNPEFNATAQSEVPQAMAQKQAMDLQDFIYKTTIEYLSNKNYFELNAGISQEKLAEDLNEAVEIINNGLSIYSNQNEIDFTDHNTWDLLTDLINDKTLFQLGKN